MKFGAVAIGRNEGERLRQCLQSLSGASAVVYVDSGSSDGSSSLARAHGAEVVDLAPPFTAARARNAGLQRLTDVNPGLAFVQFVDADCSLDADWCVTALSFLAGHPDVGVVAGRRRERYPHRSVYNWLCDIEWSGRPGEVSACGGDAMMRIDAISAIGGFREDLIAGEEPELCVRLRAAGWRIWRLDAEMALHDAAMTRLSQWWRRTTRGGYAFAQGAFLHGRGPDRHWVWESRRAWLWGFSLPLACLAASIMLAPWGLLAWLIFPLQFAKQCLRNTGSVRERAALAFFQMLARFPEVWGEIKFNADRLAGRQARIIEYK